MNTTTAALIIHPDGRECCRNTPDGRMVYRTEIIVTDIALLSGREERQTEPARRDDFGSQEVDMDDVPF